MKKGLTKRQKEILTYITDFIQRHQYSPSYREISKHFGYNSLGTVYRHLNVLKRKGMLQGEKNCSRSIVLTEVPPHESSKEIELPLIGQISAGKPIEMFAQSFMTVVPSNFVQLPESTYVLRVTGHSLHEEMIMDGDLLIVEACQSANPGETVVAIINKRDTIVKKYFPEGNFAKLSGHNVQHHPILLRHADLSIQGILKGLIRSF